MPRFSIIVAAYNVEDYLEACLASIAAQTFGDFEAIVVDDASTDGTAAISDAFAAKDARFKVVRHDVNRGRHLARLSGVEAACGDYVFFVDGDDDLASTMCAELAAALDEEPADILHFGLTVVGENGILEDECEAFEQFNNAETPKAGALDILREICDPACGYTVDWRFTQRVWETALIKRAFGRMTHERLDRSEDGYECFVATALSKTYRPFKQCRGYVYHYGRGVTGTNQITAATFARFSRQFGECLDAVDEFAASESELDLNACAVGFRRKAIELLGNDWVVRVPEEEKAEAAQAMAEALGASAAAREVWRAVRDLAWGALGEPFSNDTLNKAEAWANIAQDVQDGTTGQPALRCSAVRSQALTNLGYLRDRQTVTGYDAESIRVFVSTHKNVACFKSNILQPVQVGAGQASWRFPWALQDDAGENISGLNPEYCELTAQYWAWKNVEAEYYGFCHYRRYFDFSPEWHEENEWGEVLDALIDERSQKRYSLDDASIEAMVRQYDIITTEVKDLREFPDEAATPREHWRAAPRLRPDDLERCIAILEDMHPDYTQDADAFMDGNSSCFCNMFIMRKDIFRDYCTWLFPILERFCAETDTKLYSIEALRTPGHLAERLLNIYLMHHERMGVGWKRGQLQCVHFEQPEPTYSVVEPLSLDSEVRPVVPVVFAADEAYVPMLLTTVTSMMENASTKRFYDIVVLQCDITPASQNLMQDFLASRYGNVSLRFHNVWRMVGERSLTTSNQHISKETYYRFLVQDVLPYYDKVLYLDSDLIVQGDVAELFDTELDDKLLAAAHDVDYLGNLNFSDGERLNYTKDVLGMKDPYGYFQAGVLVMNTAAMRKAYTVEQWMEFAENPDLIYNDQDVLNAKCEGRVRYLDPAWNVMNNTFNRMNTIFSNAPRDAYRAYLDARSHPKIIHYAGGIKPWNTVGCEWEEIYWSYGRMLPNYEALASQLFGSRAFTEQKKQEAIRELTEHEKAISEDSPLRGVFDGVLPQGSRRREAAKAVVRKLRGRK